ncbi:MAG: class I SAM-dependent methyltransferase [Candidatus Brocadiaceae bacterium]|nr:class I SAM-dependent methyltransferase [Candidatus Brocadiaceae bacterium]
MATKNKNNRNWLLKILSWAFKRFRGVSKDGGGTRELSSGFLSDRVRDELIAETGRHGGDLLEIGCGEGMFLKKMVSGDKNKKNKLVGLELFFKMLERTKYVIGNDREHIDFVHAGGENMPFKEASFDRAVCVNIFYNIPTMGLIEAIIKEAGRVLRKNGVFIFEIRNKYNPFMYLLYRWVYTYDTSIGDLPLNTYFYHEINRFLKRHGLEVIRKKGVFIPLWFLSPVFIIVARKD